LLKDANVPSEVIFAPTLGRRAMTSLYGMVARRRAISPP